jgi:hypothetical protein
LAAALAPLPRRCGVVSSTNRLVLPHITIMTS